MNENKNDYKDLKVLLILFILFLVVYISKETGYYEFKTYTKTRLTEEAVKRFEKDVEDGKNVKIEDYVVNDYVDYSNFLSKTGSKIGNTIETIMNGGIKKSLKVLGDLFYE